VFTIVACLAAFLIYLAVERTLIDRSLRRIPIRIAVTGTRGKSSVTRLLASVLTEDGRRVLAKTTGSEAVLLLPDGKQVELRRRGIPSISEQIRLVLRASRLRADCLISEIMSIHPENHFFESQRILKPHIVAVTNIRLDHTEAMGENEEAIAEVIALDVAPGATVFIPEGCPTNPFSQAAERGQGRLVKTGRGESGALRRMRPEIAAREFSENLDLVCSVARHLNIEDETTVRGILHARYDIGRLRIWRASFGGRRACYLVNGFAANDPESTAQVLARVLDQIPEASDKVVGLLNLRSDRGARTLQWIDHLKRGGARPFLKLFVTGSHAPAVHRRVPEARILGRSTPEAMTSAVISDAPDGAVVFGFGNVKGAGIELVKYWSKVGESHGI